MNRGHLDAEELEALAELDLDALTVEECDGDATDEEEAAELEAAESVETTADRPGKSDKAKSRSGKGKGHLR